MSLSVKTLYQNHLLFSILSIYNILCRFTQDFIHQRRHLIMLILIFILLLIIALPTLANIAGAGTALYFLYQVRYFVYITIGILALLIITGKISWKKVEYYFLQSIRIIMIVLTLIFIFLVFQLFKLFG